MPNHNRKRPRLTAQDTFTVATKQGQLLDELAGLTPAEYETRRSTAASDLGWRVSVLDEEVQRLREAAEAEAAEAEQPIFLKAIDPWPAAVDGADLAEELVQEINAYCILPDRADVAIALWVLHAHTHDAAGTSPILCVTSPQKRCGKTTVLRVVQNLTPRALRADNVSTAAIFRTIDKWHPTFLIDEADTFLKPNQELRGVLDSGHTKDGVVVRCVGDDFEPRPFSTWTPKAIALVGQLPPTLEDRSITIRMQRKLPTERVKRLRVDKNPLADLARKITRWAADNMDDLRHARPRTLKSLHDRARDNWRPLFAIAEQLGPEWWQRARNAARVLEYEVEEETDGVMLLKDIALWFKKRPHKDRFASDEMCEWLGRREDRPWPEYGRTGKPITPNAVARLLKPFGIRPSQFRLQERVVRGYRKDDFEDAFRRYVSAP